MRGLCLTVCALSASTPAIAAERPLIVPAQGATPETLEHGAARRGLDVARPQHDADVAAESVVAEVRPMYRDMQFGKATLRMLQAEQELTEARLPTPRVATALAEVELWLGACLLVDGKGAEAPEHFALARVLAPGARPDKIFPPEVHAAFAKAAPGPKVRPKLALSPPGARLWIDGQPADETVPVGLHWIVVERADRRPAGRVLRVTHAAPEIAVHLGEAPEPGEALRQLAARARTGAVGSDEGLGVSALLGRRLWLVSATAADRFDAADVARPTQHLDVSGEPIAAVCTVEPACVPLAAPKKPIYKRAALWVPIAVAVALGVGGGVLGATLANEKSDYVVRVR